MPRPALTFAPHFDRPLTAVDTSAACSNTPLAAIDMTLTLRLACSARTEKWPIGPVDLLLAGQRPVGGRRHVRHVKELARRGRSSAS